MAYLSQRFPLTIALEPVGGPSWSTAIVATLSGDEQRNQNWLHSRHAYEVSSGVKSAADFQAVGAHFRMARGKLHTFRFKDRADFTAASTEGTLAPITATTFQLTKTYGNLVGFVEARRISRPVAGTLQIWKAGAALAAGTDFTIDNETGIVTFASAPGSAVLTAAFQFDVPVRYDTDELKATIRRAMQGVATLLSWESVPLIEDRDR